MIRLGVNIDHVATVRNARGGDSPDPVRAARLAQAAGADGITAHLREDRRHISDADIAALSSALSIPLNLEMAATDEMTEIALRHRPHAVCIVPEKREERTTEGGIDCVGLHDRLAPVVGALGQAKIRVSLFIEPARRLLFDHWRGSDRGGELSTVSKRIQSGAPRRSAPDCLRIDRRVSSGAGLRARSAAVVGSSVALSLRNWTPRNATGFGGSASAGPPGPHASRPATTAVIAPRRVMGRSMSDASRSLARRRQR